MTSPSSRARALAGRILPLFALALLAVSAAAPAVQAGGSDDEIARYADQLFSKAYPAGEPGAAVLVARDGKVLLRKGYGMASLELGVPVQPDMVFEIGSITKQITATAILMLQERGKLSVSDEVTRHLPDYPTHGQKITLEHLLTHVSGIPSFSSLPEWRPRVREDLTVQQLLDRFKDKPLDFNPGEKFAYNNSAYALLGAVIEKVSGKTYEDFVEQEIFAPLGMTHSRFGHRNEVVPGKVAGYGKKDGVYRVAEYISFTQLYAVGGLLSTVDDLALWAEAMSQGKLLKKESLAQMTTPAKLASGQSTKYAYGLAVTDEDGAQFIEHSGGIFGFVTNLLQVPAERLVVIALSNNPTAEPSPNTVAYRIARKALGKPWEDRSAVSLAPAALDEYVGVYRFPEDQTRSILHEGDQLFAREGEEKEEILASSPDVFFYRESEVRIRFQRDARGKVSGMLFLPRLGVEETGTKAGEALPAQPSGK